MFDGPIDLTPYGTLPKAIPLMYLGFVVIIRELVVWFAKRWPLRLMLAVLIPGVMLPRAKFLLKE